MKAEEIVKKFSLAPHPEGGYYGEVLRTDQKAFTMDNKRKIIKKAVSTGTSIYYLLQSEAEGHFSAWHRLHGLDETWNYHAGAPLNIYWLEKNGNLVTKILGLVKWATPQVHVPRGHWFAASVVSSDPEAYVLAGCAVSPAFDFSNTEFADRDELTREHPKHKDIIHKLTRPPAGKPI